MDTQDRRLAANAPLRQKMNRIQAANRRMKDAADRLEQQTLSMMRSGEVVSLPCAALAEKELGRLLTEQKQTLNGIRHEMLGPELGGLAQSAAPLVSPDELAALLRPNEAAD